MKIIIRPYFNVEVWARSMSNTWQDEPTYQFLYSYPYYLNVVTIISLQGVWFLISRVSLSQEASKLFSQTLTAKAGTVLAKCRNKTAVGLLLPSVLLCIVGKVLET